MRRRRIGQRCLGQPHGAGRQHGLRVHDVWPDGRCHSRWKEDVGFIGRRFAVSDDGNGYRWSDGSTELGGQSSVFPYRAVQPALHADLPGRATRRSSSLPISRPGIEKGNIPHIQFNVVSSETLREAQVEPAEHPDLIVRVAGYSAHFVDLPRYSQDSIIDRTEQELH